LHIQEGILSPPVLIAGGVVAAAGVVVGLRRIDDERIPRIAVLSSAFFVASLIHVPVGPSNAHLVLNGMMGILLGWAAFPALLIALLLQAVLFGFGGLTTLGVNVTSMAVPAVLCCYAFGRGLRRGGPAVAFLSGFAAGFTAILLSAALVCAALVTTGREFLRVAEAVGLAHLPIAIIEGLITASLGVFLRKVKPEVLEVDAAPAGGKESNDA